MRWSSSSVKYLPCDLITVASCVARDVHTPPSDDFLGLKFLKEIDLGEAIALTVPNEELLDM